MEYAPDELEKKEAELTEAEKAIQEKETQLDQAEVALGIGYAQGVGQIQKALNGISEGLFPKMEIREMVRQAVFLREMH